MCAALNWPNRNAAAAEAAVAQAQQRPRSALAGQNRAKLREEDVYHAAAAVKQAQAGVEVARVAEEVYKPGLRA